MRTRLRQAYGVAGRLRSTSRCGEDAPLFAAKRHHDLFIVASQDHSAILNSLDRDLIDLSAYLETKLLAFLHRFAIDDGNPRPAIDRDGADEERAGRNFTLIRSAAGSNFSSRFPANRPKWVADAGIDVERRFIFHGDGDGLIGAKRSRGDKDRQAENGAKFLHRFSVTVVTAIATC